jgi:hypothetical protein
VSHEVKLTDLFSLRFGVKEDLQDFSLAFDSTTNHFAVKTILELFTRKSVRYDRELRATFAIERRVDNYDDTIIQQTSREQTAEIRP